MGMEYEKRPEIIMIEIEEGDDQVCFYSRKIGERRIVIVPKDRFLLNETETTYVLTLKNE